MNVNLKSKELISLFQNNGILTPSIAQKRANNIEINLTGPVSNELIEDIKQIAYEFPNLLRHITVKNNTDKPIDMQKLVDAIGEEKRFNSRFKKFISFKVESTHREDFNLDYGNFHKLLILDYLSCHNIKPSIWWEEKISPKEKSDLLRKYHKEGIINYDLTTLYKYSLLIPLENVVILAIYKNNTRKIHIINK